MSPFDQKYRILQSIVDDPANSNRSITTDFKIPSSFLTASGVLGELADDRYDSENGPKFTSPDGVIPLTGETAEDVGLLVKWLTRAKGFSIDINNVNALLRLSDKLDIESLRKEINVYYVFWISLEMVTPNYDIWEAAARVELTDVEEHCRESALKQIKKQIEEGEGLGYFLKRGIRAELLTILIRELYYRRSQEKGYGAEDAILRQMAAAQM